MQLSAGCGSSQSDDSPAAVRPAGGAGVDAGANAGTASMGGAPDGVGGGSAGANSGGESGVPSSPSDAGASGEPDVGFVPAPHAQFPLVTAHGGPVIPQMEVTPVYFGDDPLKANLESFNDWILGSDYWKAIGADYGVMAGSRLPAVQFTTVPAMTMSDTQIASWVAARIGDGSLPKPSARTMFALFYPAGTTITSGSGTSTSCFGFAGLHQSASMANAVFIGSVPYVIIPRCSFSAGDELTIATDVASHEYLEAATNPFASDPAWSMDTGVGKPLEAWNMLNGPEVSDLCENQAYDVVEGFTVQDAWSNSAALSGNNPCQPSDPKHPFFMASADDTIYHAQFGSTLTVHARAWSNMPAPDWSLGVNWGYVPNGNFDGHAVLSRTTVNNGDEITATVTVPASAPILGGRSVYRFTIDSIDPINPNFYHPWPVMVVVP